MYVQFTQLRSEYAKAVRERDDAHARLLSFEAIKGQGSYVAEELQHDIVRITERLSTAAGLNAQLMAENSQMSQQVEVRFSCS
jgi:hypothetical protein